VANTLSSFFQTLVASATEASQLLAPTWNASGSVYLDYQPVAATIGQTLNIAIPQDPTNSVNDQGTGDLVLSDIGFTTTPIVFNKHPSFGFVVRDFEQFNSPTDIRNVFMDAALKGVKNNINQAVCNLFVTGNFTTNAAISDTASTITVTHFMNAMARLADQNVPVANDPTNMSLLLPSTPYTALMDPSSTPGAFWTQAQIAAIKTPEYVRQYGEMPTSFGCTIKLDQQMPTTGTAGSRTFTGSYFHRWAIALASRPLATPDSNIVKTAFIEFGGISVRVSVGYNQYPKQGWIVSVDAGYGLKVVRENLGQLFTIAE